MASKFRTWFDEQFGKRNRAFARTSDNALAAIENKGRAARRELDRREAWDYCQNAALYGYHFGCKGKKMAEVQRIHKGNPLCATRS